MVYPRFFVDRFGHRIELTSERWNHILDRHQELTSCEHFIPEVLESPNTVRRSIYDPAVHLYYRYFPHIFNGKFLVVVVEFSRRPNIMTAYITHRCKGGPKLWPKD